MGEYLACRSEKADTTVLGRVVIAALVFGYHDESGSCQSWRDILPFPYNFEQVVQIPRGRLTIVKHFCWYFARPI